MIGLVSDLIASNRRILADTQYHVKRMEYEFIEERKKKAMLDVKKEMQIHSNQAEKNVRSVIQMKTMC